MAVVTVLGAGMMGSALCVPLVDAGHEVRLVGTHLDGEIIAELRRSHTHPKLQLPLPGSILPFSLEELPAAMSGAELVGVGVSSAGLSWAAQTLAPHLRPDHDVVMITKGLHVEGDAAHVLPDVFRATLADAAHQPLHPAAIAGPCIAGELARRVPTCVVLTGRDRAALERIAAALETSYYHLFIDDDVVGVEVCAALKNAYAMGIALALGLHEKSGGQPGSVAMHNYEAAVFAQAVWEMQAFVAAAGGAPASASWLPGVGDLDVTTNGGRTGRFGKLLGLGLRPDEAVERMQGATLECLEILAAARRALPALRARGMVRLPLLEHLVQIALDGDAVQMPFADFFGRGGA